MLNHQFTEGMEHRDAQILEGKFPLETQALESHRPSHMCLLPRCVHQAAPLAI